MGATFVTKENKLSRERETRSSNTEKRNEGNCGSWNRIVSRFEESRETQFSRSMCSLEKKETVSRFYRLFSEGTGATWLARSLAVKSAARGPASADRHGTCAHECRRFLSRLQPTGPKNMAISSAKRNTLVGKDP